MSTVDSLAPDGVLFVMISTVSSDVPLRSELAWWRSSKSSRRSHAAPFHSPSCSTLPSFPAWIPAPHSTPTFALSRACPPTPSHNLSSTRAPCPQSTHYFIHDFLILKTNQQGEAALNSILSIMSEWLINDVSGSVNSVMSRKSEYITQSKVLQIVFHICSLHQKRSIAVPSSSALSLL